MNESGFSKLRARITGLYSVKMMYDKNKLPNKRAAKKNPQQFIKHWLPTTSVFFCCLCRFVQNNSVHLSALPPHYGTDLSFSYLPTAYVVRGKVMFWPVSVHPSVCPHGGTPPGRGGGDPGQVWLGEYPSQAQIGGGGTPSSLQGVPPSTGQQMEYLIRCGQYASCVHAGGLSSTSRDRSSGRVSMGKDHYHPFEPFLSTRWTGPHWSLSIWTFFHGHIWLVLVNHWQLAIPYYTSRVRKITSLINCPPHM